MNHTRAPWRHDGADFGDWTIYSGDKIVGWLEGFNNDWDAHLICAAPVLLEALEHARAVIKYDHKDDKRYAELIEDIDAAIDQARDVTTPHG